jgi:hypothetical protein
MKKICCIVLSVLLLLSAALPAAAFGDVPADAYYAAAVDWALAAGVTEGTSAETFSPGDTCTRGQVVTFLWRAMGRPAPEATEEPSPTCRRGTISTRASSGRWSGDHQRHSETTFSPKDKCTCAQIITFLWRAAGWPSTAGDSALTAGWPDSYYKGAVSWADAAASWPTRGLRPGGTCSGPRPSPDLPDGRGTDHCLHGGGAHGAIGSNRTIYLEAGTYNLTTGSRAWRASGDRNPCLRIEEVLRRL